MNQFEECHLRPAQPDDYDAIAAAVDSWWGRPILGALPRLFLDRFHSTSLVTTSGGVEDRLQGFLIGIISDSPPHQAYIHFVGVHPEARRTGLAGTLYQHFFAMARAHERSVVQAITSPVNGGSIAFHRRMGFTVRGPVADYNGPGHDMMVFERSI